MPASFSQRSIWTSCSDKVSSGDVTVSMNENIVKVTWNHGDDEAILTGKAGLLRTS